MSIENTVPRLLASLFSVDGNAPATGAEIIEANADEREATIEALTTALHTGKCEGGANGADVALILEMTDHMDREVTEVAESLKAGWDCIDEIDNQVDGPDCDDNYVWRVIDGHAFLIFDAHGLCGIRADYIAERIAERLR